jgi:hypothetical protein
MIVPKYPRLASHLNQASKAQAHICCSYLLAKVQRFYWNSIGDPCFFCSPRNSWATEETWISNRNRVDTGLSEWQPIEWQLLEDSWLLYAQIYWWSVKNYVKTYFLSHTTKPCVTYGFSSFAALTTSSTERLKLLNVLATCQLCSFLEIC